MTAILDSINAVLWGYLLVYGLVAVGIFFTLRLRLLQVLRFGEMLRTSLSARGAGGDGITPFQALCTSLASRVGTGNIAGVAVALVLGGPGAIFWMWIVAFLGMATAYGESALAQLYKVKDTGGAENVYRGGPAYYIASGMKMRWLAVLFSLCLIFALGLVVNALQANSIADAMEGAFGLPKAAAGVLVAVVTGLVIFGGIRKIAHVAEYIVPFMAGLYFLVTVAILILNIAEIPGVLAEIVRSALGLDEAIGGVTGGVMAAMLNGVKRGLFSNEAGMGSAPNIAAAATPVPHHPASQGLVQAFAVFIDTIVICTCTAVFILLSSAYVPGGEVTATQLTQIALAEHIGSAGPVFIAVAIFFFAFTTIIGCYAYSEMAMSYLGLGHRRGLFVLRCGVLAMVVWGAMQTIATVFNLADAAIGIMALINLFALLALSGTIVALTRDYFRQRDAGQEPRFIAKDHPALGEGIDPEIWK